MVVIIAIINVDNSVKYVLKEYAMIYVKKDIMKLIIYVIQFVEMEFQLMKKNVMIKMMIKVMDVLIVIFIVQIIVKYVLKEDVKYVNKDMN